MVFLRTLYFEEIIRYGKFAHIGAGLIRSLQDLDSLEQDTGSLLSC